MGLRLVYIVIIGLLLALPLSATETEHLGIAVLPTPGSVAVDGKTDDWDLSGGILACGDVENARDKVSVWFHAMYDANNLYLLARWNDEKPLNNPGVTAGDFGFQGDCLQVRVITDPEKPDERCSHLTMWRGRDGRDVIDAAYGRQFDKGTEQDLQSQGAQQEFALDGDGKGYTQEIAIPWSLLASKDRVPKAGDSLRMAVEPNFTIGANGRLSIKDIFQPGMTLDRIFTFMSSNQWGTATLEKQGKLAPRPVRLSDAREFKVRMEDGAPAVDWTGLIKSRELKGFKSVKLTMPEDGYVSLHLRNADGEVVRQLLNCELVTKGEHEFKWDGLSTPNFRKPGEPVPPGVYTWHAIYHTGIGLRLKGWACNAGMTPWDFPANKGNWGGDHGAPSAVATDATQVYLSWTGAEAGKALLACDLEGNVLWNNTHGGIGGASAIAVDDTTVFALNYKALYRVNKKDGVYNSWQGTDSTDLPIASIFADFQESPEHRFMFTVGGGKLYISSQKHNQVAVLNAATGKVERRIAVKSPRNVTVAPSGKLYVVSAGEAVLAYEPGSDQAKQVVGGLQNATSVAVNKDGEMFVGVGDPENQIKVFAADGKPLHSIGRAGGRSLVGPWTSDGMRFVNSVALDAAGKLWVVEADMAPKRISVWKAATSEFVKELFGPATYGALGGAICPADPNIMLGQGCEWRLDPDTGRAKCLAVVTRDGMENSRFGTGSNNRVYLAVCDSWAFSNGTVRIFERLGDAQYKMRSSFRYEGKDQDVKTIFWADKNDDAQVQAEETVTVPGNLRFSSWYMHMAGNLSISAGDKLLRVTGFTPCGAPVWDVANPQKMPASGAASADDRLVVQWGEYGVDHGWLRCFDIASGKPRWSYPDTFVGVHGSHNAPPPEVGLIRGSYPPCGVAKLPAPIGNIWAIPTNLGEWHLLTDQGFYLTRLFLQGDSLNVQWPETAVPGAILDNVPPGMGGEDFGGSITLGTDGKLYIQAGKTAFWNVEVVGLESVKAVVSSSANWHR